LLKRKTQLRLRRLSVRKNQPDTANIGLGGLVQQQAMDGIVVKLILLKLVDTIRLKTKFFTIDLMAYAEHFLEHVALDSRNNLKVGFKKVG